MKRTWFWLEDQGQTVADFRQDVERSVAIEFFNSPTGLVRRLGEFRQENSSDILATGFILDIMLTSHPIIMSPPSWNGSDKPMYFQTRNGSDAGLVFYEQLMLAGEGSGLVFPLPPPVVFLTVVQSDHPGFSPRFARIKSRWAEAYGISLEKAKVEWMRKWDVKSVDLKNLLISWEKD